MGFFMLTEILKFSELIETMFTTYISYTIVTHYMKNSLAYDP